jgi:hypothetical protein
MEVDLKSLFGLHVTWCAQLYSLAGRPCNATPPKAFEIVYEGRYRSAKIDDISLQPLIREVPSSNFTYSNDESNEVSNSFETFDLDSRYPNPCFFFRNSRSANPGYVLAIFSPGCGSSNWQEIFKVQQFGTRLNPDPIRSVDPGSGGLNCP